MAKTFKPSPFENIIKKYTLCGLCDGKIIDSSFLQCGCSVILCIYCNEIHSCKFHQQAVKFDSSKENKSISFIQQLSALMTTYASDKDKENKGLIENSHSSSLPDLDDLMVNETANGGDLSFSQLFDDRCSRNEKPRLSLSSIKRESISPRISYTLKRKQYLSDSEDEESFNKSESILYKGLSDRSSSVKKKISKKMKISNKSQDTSIFSSIGCDSDSLNSDKQPLERKKRSRKGRHSLPAGMSSSVVNDVSTSPLHQVSSPFPESCQTVQKTNVPSEDDKTYVEHNNDAENNSSYFRETIKEEDIENVASPVKNTSDDKLCANYIDGTFKNSSFEENADKNEVLSTCEPDDDEMVMISIIDNINQNLEEDDVKPMTAKKQRNSVKHVKKSKSIKNKTVESDEQRKQQDNDLSNCNLGDFDGFDQCDINTSTLNYMLYKLTTPCNDNDEMIFPIHYRGKTFVIHLKDKFDGEFNDNEYHYILKPFKTSSNHSAQTDPLTMPEDKAIGITQTDSNDIAETCVGEDVKASFVQTDSYQVIDACVGHDGHKASSVQTDSSQLVDACVGREGEKASFVQTNGYQVQDACVGRKGEKDSFVQTDGYRVGDACVGPDGKISEVTQTDRYFVRDSYTSTKDFRCCAVQTNLTINSSANLWNHTDIAVQSDVHNNEVCDISSDMPYSNVNAHYPTSDTVRNNTSYELNPKVSISLAIADVKEDSDNEDEDIIEGTPIKANNLSFASLNLSALKGRNHRFDWNDSIIARDDTISCSDLTNVDKFIVQKFTKCFGMEYSEYFNNKTTHLVVSSRLSHGSHKTFKYLIAIASKACIVSIEWVKDSLLRKELLPVDDYIPINHPGPMRCRMNGNLPLTGLTICVQLLTNYPGVKAMEALCKLCGAYIVEDIKQCNSSQSWPFPRFCLFEDESQLTCQILNSCSKNHIVAINFEWVFDSVAAYCRQPILKYICSTFLLTEDIIETYKIPSDMLVDDCS